MNLPLSLPLMVLVFLGVATPAEAGVPSFKKRDSIDKTFLKEVGEAVVKAVRSKPARLELGDYRISDPKPNRKVLTIKMVWHGAATGKKFTSDIKITIDPTQKDNWEVLEIEYDDDNPLLKFGLAKNLKELRAEFNR